MIPALIHEQSVEELPDVDAILHDTAFSMAEVAYDNDRGIVTIPFHASPRMHDFRLLRRRRRAVTGEGPEGYLLEVARAVVIVCRDETVARRRFGIEGGGVCYTRTGRPFFEDPAIKGVFLDRVRMGLERSGLWDELGTDWLALDCEVLPWSAKALELLKGQYAAVGTSARAALTASISVIEAASYRGVDVATLLVRHQDRLAMAERFPEAYGRYSWKVSGIDDLRLAPFQVLAGEGCTYTDRDHGWHMGVSERLAEGIASAISGASNW